MPLTIQMQVGDSVRVGVERIELVKIHSKRGFAVIHYTSPDTGIQEVTAIRWVEVFPGCKVRAASGFRSSPSKLASVQIDAPQFYVTREPLRKKATS